MTTIRQSRYQQEGDVERLKRKQAFDILIAVVVIGSIWGVLEILLGAGMRSAGIPHKGDVLTAVGIGLMALAFAIYRKALMLIAIAAIAASMRQLAVPILHLSFFCKANSCLAVMLGGIAVAGFSRLMVSQLKRGHMARIGAGFSSGFATGIGFYFIGMHVAPCRYLLSFNRPGGLVAFIGAEALIWAALGAITFPVGYRIGEKLRESIQQSSLRRPLSYYASLLALAGLCWIAGAIAIASGL